MWVYKQALISMKMEKNLTRLYLLAATITTFIIFTAINISGNSILISTSEVMLETFSYFTNGTSIEVLKKIQKE